MKLLLTRTTFSPKSTMGDLVVDGVPECYTLEPATPIPVGTYALSLYDSPRFHEVVPLLMNVPGHDFIEFHPGNAPQDTKDCILPGINKAKDWVGNSRAAFINLRYKIEKAMREGEEVWIEITEQQEGAVA